MNASYIYLSWRDRQVPSGRVIVLDAGDGRGGPLGPMRGEPSCPKCGGRVRAPGLFADSWQCDRARHRASAAAGRPAERRGPRRGGAPGAGAGVDALAAAGRLALHRRRLRGRRPQRRPRHRRRLLGARAARRSGRADAGRRGAGRRARRALRRDRRPRPGPAHVRRQAAARQGRSPPAGRPRCGTSAAAPDDRAVFAGEARGLWLWAVVWPEQSGLLMYDELVLTDLRDAGAEVDLLPCGALSPPQPVLTAGSSPAYGRARTGRSGPCPGSRRSDRLSLAAPCPPSSSPLESAPCASTCTPTPRPRTVRTPPPSWCATPPRPGWTSSRSPTTTPSRGHAEALARAARRADPGHRRRAVLPARRHQPAHAGVPLRPRGARARPRARARTGRPGAARPGHGGQAPRAGRARRPGSRSPGSPATARSAGRTSPPRWSKLGVVATVSDAFTPEWLADGGRAYVEKHELDPFDAIRLVKAAGGVTVFAHPLAVKRGECVPESAIAELAAAGLDGIEVDHMDHDEPTRARLRGLAADLGLLATGSSDYHGSRKTCRLGEYTTDPEIYGEITRRAARGLPGCRRPLRAEPLPARPASAPPALHVPSPSPPGLPRPTLSRKALTVFDVAVFGSLFLTLFVIMDPPGITPIFLALTSGRPAKVQRRMAWQAVGRRLRRDRRLRASRPADPGLSARLRPRADDRRWSAAAAHRARPADRQDGRAEADQGRQRRAGAAGHAAAGRARARSSR